GGAAVPRLEVLDGGHADAAVVGELAQREVAGAAQGSQPLSQDAQLRQSELGSLVHTSVAPGLRRHRRIVHVQAAASYAPASALVNSKHKDRSFENDRLQKPATCGRIDESHATRPTRQTVRRTTRMKALEHTDFLTWLFSTVQTVRPGDDEQF